MNRYEGIINQIELLACPLDNEAPIKERVLLGYTQQVKEALALIVSSSSDDFVVAAQLVDYLKKGWDFPRIHTAYPDSEIIKLLCALAESLCEQHNASLKKGEKPWTALELLMPKVNLESNHPDYPHLKAFEKPRWDALQEKQLSLLKEKMTQSGLPEQEEGVEEEMSTEEQDSLSEYNSLLWRYGRYKKEEDNAALEQLKTSAILASALAKQEQRNRISQVHRLEAQQQTYRDVAKSLSAGQATEYDQYVLPVFNLNTVLKTHILSAQSDSLIPISVLLGDPSLRPYQPIDSEAFASLSTERATDEAARLQHHSPETRALCEAQQRLETIKYGSNNLLGYLTRLCGDLRLYDAHEGIGRQDNAGSGVYEPIRQFSDYYETLGYQIRRRTKEAQILAEGFIYVEVIWTYDTQEFELLYSLKSGKEIIQDKIDKKDLPQLAAKIEQRQAHIYQLEAAGKKGDAITSDVIFEELKDLKGYFLAITHQRQHTLKEKEEKNKIPDKLKAEIELLLTLSKDQTSNESATETLQTCIGTRREVLEKLMAGKEALLAAISSSEQHQAGLVREAINDVAQAQTALEAMLKTNNYAGEDKLPLSMQLLERLNITLEFKSRSELTAFMELSTEEIKALGTKEGGNLQLATLISSINDLVLFVHEHASHKVEAFLDITAPHLLYRLCGGRHATNALLSSLEGDKLKILVRALLPVALIDDPVQLKEMMLLIPPEHRLQVVKGRDYRGNTFLYNAASKPASLKMILELVLPEHRLDMIKEKNQDGNTILRLLAHDLMLLEMTLNLLPQEHRLEVLKIKDQFERTILSTAVRNPEFLKLFLGLLPPEHRLKAIKEKDEYGDMILHCAIQNPKSLKIILDLLPEEQRLEAIKEKGKYGCTILNYPVRSAELLKIFLSSLSEEQRLEALKVTDQLEDPLLHKVVQNLEFLEIILGLLSQKQRLQALNIKNHSGYTVLHEAVKTPASLKLILELLPLERRLEAVKEKNQSGVMVLDLALCVPGSLHVIFQSLPPTLLQDEGVVEDIKRYLPYKDNKEFIDSLYINLLNDRLTALREQSDKPNVVDWFIGFFKKPIDYSPKSKMNPIIDAMECFKSSIQNNTPLAQEHLDILREEDVAGVIRAFAQVTDNRSLHDALLPGLDSSKKVP